jgi:hypothetical protein
VTSSKRPIRSECLDPVVELGNMFRQPRVDTFGDRRHVGPDCGYHVGHGLHPGHPLLEGSDPLGEVYGFVWHQGILLVSGPGVLTHRRGTVLLS